MSFAVRWARRESRREKDWTVWHMARSDRFTACGWNIPYENEIEAEEDIGLVECEKCKNTRWFNK